MKSSTILLALAAALLASHAIAFTPSSSAYYTLTTKFRESANECLEGNKFSSGSTLGGSAFMAPCTTPASGQLWKFISLGNGLYRMTTLFLEGQGKCFEGNKFAPTSTLKGAAFMDNCRNVSGQIWKIQPAGAYFKLTTLFREPFGECLEGNKFAATSTLGGAAFMSRCLPFTGQLWRATAH